MEASLPEAQGAALAAHWLGKIIPKSGEKGKLSARRAENILQEICDDGRADVDLEAEGRREDVPGLVELVRLVSPVDGLEERAVVVGPEIDLLDSQVAA